MRAKGLVPLGWYDAGARSFYNSVHSINTPADVEGLKVRVMSNDLFVGMVESLNGNATPMAFGEVFQSIKTGVVDGAENNPPSYESTSHYDVAPYYSLTEHLIIPEILVFSKKTWESLSKDDQALLTKLGKEAQMEQRQLWYDAEKTSIKQMTDAGVEIIKIADKKPFQAAVKPVWDKYGAAHAGLIQRIQDTK
jgi:TRAP-type C4-dicarboxylate transport system substrate-binding protein